MEEKNIPVTEELIAQISGGDVSLGNNLQIRLACTKCTWAFGPMEITGTLPSVCPLCGGDIVLRWYVTQK
jgi:hypothetical protein